MHPPEKEKAASAEAALIQNFDTETVVETSHEVNDYAIRQERMNREYIAACKAAGIKPDTSYRGDSSNFQGAL